MTCPERPVEEALTHRVTRDGVGYYYRAGVGTTAVVLIHGMGGSSCNWGLVTPLLPADTPLVLVDLPWCATSKGYHGRSEPDGLVDAIRECVSDVWNGPVVIAAHSIGGFFAWRFMDQDEILVAGLVLVSAHLFAVGDILSRPFSLDKLPLRLALADAIIRSFLKPARFLRSAVNCSAAARRLLMWPIINPVLADGQARVGDCFRGNGGLGSLRMIREARKIDLYGVAQSSDRPTSIVIGADDPLLTGQDNARIGELANVTAIWQVNGARHFPIIETPGVVASAIIEQLGRIRDAEGARQGAR